MTISVSQWLENPHLPISTWNICGEEHRTNNTSEGYNSKLNRAVSNKHPNIYELINSFATGDAYMAICINFSTVYNDTLVAKELTLSLPVMRIYVNFSTVYNDMLVAKGLKFFITWKKHQQDLGFTKQSLVNPLKKDKTCRQK